MKHKMGEMKESDEDRIKKIVDALSGKTPEDESHPFEGKETPEEESKEHEMMEASGVMKDQWDRSPDEDEDYEDYDSDEEEDEEPKKKGRLFSSGPIPHLILAIKAGRSKKGE